MELILIRHGLPLRVELDSGRADPALSELGQRQAHQVIDCLARERIDAIYTSPMRRAMETAQPLAEARELEATVCDNIAEYDSGASHYIPMEELKAQDYAAWQAYVDGGYGDDFDIEMFGRRVASGLESIIAAHPGARGLSVMTCGFGLDHRRAPGGTGRRVLPRRGGQRLGRHGA